MSTAIIVSGSLRQLVNASSSWTIPGDYYLIVDQNTYNTADLTVVGNSFEQLADNIRQCHVKFVTVSVVIDNNLSDNIRHHTTINMINKWRQAYYAVLPYTVNRTYDKVILLRPDCYLNGKQPLKLLLDTPFEDDTVYSTTELINKHHDQWGDRLIMNDVLLMFNWTTFNRFVNELLPYYIENYNLTQQQGYEVHTMLAKFCKERNFKVTNHVANYFDFAILRNTSELMFAYGSLMPNYSFNNLLEAEQLWWKNTYGKN